MINLEKVIDIYTPSAPGSLMRAARVDSEGVYRLARRDCELYSIMIVSAGAWGRLRVTDGNGRSLFLQPSTFSGSFWLSAGAEDGLLVHVGVRSDGDAGSFTINWREEDMDMV